VAPGDEQPRLGMHSVVDWLISLGLAKYQALFAENEIDWAVLPRLTDADLKDLGLPLGPRKKLLDAIATLGAGVPGGPVTDLPRDAERRHLTVMFCDLVGSTPLATALDPEDLRPLLTAYQEAVATTVQRYDGFVAKFLGDGVLAYFGYPRAHEDDAERAVRAALDLTASVPCLPVPGDRPLACRVGIATGLVVVSESLHVGSAAEQSVVGETPNLAARLQELAPPNGVVVAPATQHLLGSHIQLMALEPRLLKGFPAAVQAWRVVGLQSAESRFAAAHSRSLTRFVGRDSEVALLLDRWEQAADGEGQVVLLSGEPGIGKSRTCEALRERLAAQPHLVIRYQCSPYHVNSPLYPALHQMERAAQFLAEDSPGQKLDKLERLLRLATDDLAATVPLFAAALSLPTEGRYPSLTLTPEQQRRMMLRAFQQQLQGRADRQPVLFLVEDAHWIDPSTREIIEASLDPVARARVLMVVTARPEFGAPWREHSHMTLLTLTRLGQKQCAAMVAEMPGSAVLPEPVVRDIVARADGVPLFIEELTKSVLEAAAGVPSPRLTVPATLQDSLMARLDRLPAAKEVAQIGAIIGREFPYSIVAQVSEMPASGLSSSLQELEDAGLLFRRGAPPEATYTFKHALVQDTARATLLRAKGRTLHARVAEVLERDPSNVALTDPGLIAQHYADGGVAPKAAAYWLAAGRLANARSASREAIAHLEAGLKAASQLPLSRDRISLELDMQIAHATACIVLRGYAADDTRGAYLRGRDLLRELGEDPRQFAVLYGLFVTNWNRAKYQDAIEVAGEMLASAEAAARRDDVRIAHQALAVGLNPMGRFAEARDHARRAWSYYDPERDRASSGQYGHDVGVAALCHLMLAESYLGSRDAAAHAQRTALGLARKLDHPNTLGYSLMWSAHAKLPWREMAEAQGLCQELIPYVEAQGLPFWAALGQGIWGASCAASDPDRALQLIAQGRAAQDAMQSRI
jgi:class 3 adenylate cyclase